MKKLSIAMLVAGLVSCGPPPPPQYGGAEPVGPNGRPLWVDGRSSRYPDMMFLTGVGHGPSQPQCENDARAALAKIFNAQISQVSQDWQGYYSKASNLGVQVKMEAVSISQLTNVSTEKTIEGAQIKEHWDGDGTHHCLAVLEREPAERTLREKIMQMDNEIQSHIARGDSEANSVQKFMAYSAALEILPKREVLNADLRIVSSRGAGMPLFDTAALLAKFSSSKAQVKVGLKITGQESARIQTCLIQELSAKGIQVLEGTSDVDMMIHGNLKYQKAGYVEGSEMVRADINLRITDLATGRTVAAFTEDVKVGRPALQQSVQLAVFKLCEQSAPSLVQKIRASFSK